MPPIASSLSTSRASAVRLIRPVNHPGKTGPIRGQYALQKALRTHGPSWLRIGGTLRPGEIPWFWCWKDRDVAAMMAVTGEEPGFIVGPNILFEDSRHPCSVPAEQSICDAANCRLIFTESIWYRELIERQRGPANRAPIVICPYPIDPKPAGPLTDEYDLLVYRKSGFRSGLVRRLLAPWRRICQIDYGHYRRDALIAAARRARCCLYLSDDDRGPLALAEILLAGCPAIGVPTGAPFIVPGRTGVLLDRCDEPEHWEATCCEAIAACHRLDRNVVAALASRQFDTPQIVATMCDALRVLITRPNIAS